MTMTTKILPPLQAAVVALAATVFVAGCTSTSQIDTALDVAPPALATPAAPPPPEDLAPRITVRNTGTFPNINVEPEPSLQQISPSESAALTAEMEQLRAAHASGRISTTAYQQRIAYLERLAQSHSREMVNRIEAQP